MFHPDSMQETFFFSLDSASSLSQFNYKVGAQAKKQSRGWNYTIFGTYVSNVWLYYTVLWTTE